MTPQRSKQVTATLRLPAHSPRSLQKRHRRKEPITFSPLLNMCSAQKQCVQTPGEINILIQVSQLMKAATATV